MGLSVLTENVAINITSPFGTFLSYLYLFIIGSMLGYVGEVLFRRFFSMKKWINPGFLKGPYIPLYGFGLCVLHLVSSISLNYFCDPNSVPSYYYNPYESHGVLPFWATSIIAILLIGVLLTLVEYIAGIVFVKGLHIKLWDYSNLKGNIQGIICPLFSFIWLIGGVVYWFGLMPIINYALVYLNNHLWGLTFVIGAFFGCMVVDFINSLVLSIKLSGKAKELKLTIDYEKFKINRKKDSKGLFQSSILDAIKVSSEPIREKIGQIVNDAKKHLYINNEIPKEAAAKSNETPRMKEEKIKKEEEEKKENATLN